MILSALLVAAHLSGAPPQERAAIERLPTSDSVCSGDDSQGQWLYGVYRTGKAIIIVLGGNATLVDVKGIGFVTSYTIRIGPHVEILSVMNGENLEVERKIQRIYELAVERIAYAYAAKDCLPS